MTSDGPSVPEPSALRTRAVGGYKQSGVGRELGEWGIREYQQTKYIHVDQTPRKDQKFWLQIAGL